MILRPLMYPSNSHSTNNAEPVWQIISRTQNFHAEQYLLIGQPEHARLSGELASRFRASFLPSVDAVITKAISIHDEGWTTIPFERDLNGQPPATSQGRPQHFMQVPVDQSLRAWEGSIICAGEVGPLARFIVSSHFSRIARLRIQLQMDLPPQIAQLERFALQEEDEQEQLLQSLHLSAKKSAQYVDLLQFCDALSLYLCCGSTEPAQFPQRFCDEPITIQYEDGVFTTHPSLFGGQSQRFSLHVRLYPTSANQGHTRIAFHVL
jgi:hypothetical protein